MTVKYSAFFPAGNGAEGTAVPATRNVNLGEWSSVTNGTTLNVGDTVQYFGSTFVVVTGHIKGVATGAPDVNPNYQIYASVGSDGQTLYTWIAYADSADGTSNFTAGDPGTRIYIGIANNKTGNVESSNPADYTWSKMQGPVGPSILINPDKAGFIYVNGILNPASQTVTYTATLSGITGTISWTTTPNIKSGTGTTFAVTSTEMGANSQVVVNATVDGKTQSVLLQKIADSTANRTQDNTAAAIINQGSLATSSTANYYTQVTDTPPILSQNLFDRNGSWKSGLSSSDTISYIDLHPVTGRYRLEVAGTLTNREGPLGTYQPIVSYTAPSDGYYGHLKARYEAVDGYSTKKTYIFYQWVKYTHAAHGPFFGLEGTVRTLAGVDDGNAYWINTFANQNLGGQPFGWYLFVGVLHPDDYTGGYSGISGIYNTNGVKVTTATEWKAKSGAQYAGSRYFIYAYSGTVEVQATKPTMAEMTALTNPVAEILATVGATTGTNIYNTSGTLLTQSALVTAEGTAAAIAGQAATATDSSYTAITGAKPSINAGSSLSTLIAGGETQTFTINGNTLVQVAQTSGWNAWAYSNQAMLDSAMVSARFVSITANGPAFGLVTVSQRTTSNWPSLSYGLYREGSDGSIRAMESGVTALVAAGGTWTSSDVFSIAYDGVRVRYYKNDTLLRTVVSTAGQIFFFKAIFDTSTGSLADIQAGSFTDNTWASIDGEGIPADYAGTTLSLYEPAGNTFFNIAGNSIYAKTNIGSYRNVYSKESVLGSAYISGRMRGSSVVFGLAENLPNLSGDTFDVIKHGWHYNVDGSWYIYHAGSFLLSGTSAFGVTYSINTIFSIVYDGKFVRWYADGVQIHNESVAANKRFHAGYCSQNLGSGADQIMLTPAGQLPVVGTNVYDGTTLLTAAQLITLQGTAASITGQAATATSSDYSIITGTKPDSAASQGDNYFKNGSFNDGVLPWQIIQGSRVATAAGAPAPFAAKKNAGTYLGVELGTTPVPASTGDIYFSARAKGISADTFQLVLTFYDAASAYISQPNGSVSLTNSNWIPLELKFARPANAAFYTAQAYVYTTSANNEVYLTSLRLSGTQLGATLGADVASNVYSGSTLLTAAQLITLQGTAAAITGQGSLATKSSVSYGTGDVSGFGALAGLATADYDTYVSGGTKPAQYAGKILDTRATDEAPSYYYALHTGAGGVGAQRIEFKNSNFSSSGSSGFGTLVTDVQWADGTGGPVKQMLTDSAGQVFERISTATTTWGTWQRNYNGFYKPAFGADLLEAAAGTIATLANFKTSAGVAASIASQGSFATISSAAYGSSYLTGFGSFAPLNELYYGYSGFKETSGGVTATLANFKTSAGVAASIASQGALATKSSVTYGTADVSGFGALAAISSAAYGSSYLTGFGSFAPLNELYFGYSGFKETTGGVVATLTNFKTSSGVAASITGQGSFATISSVSLTSAMISDKSLANLDSTADIKLVGIEATADVTSYIIPGQTPINISASSTGVIKTDNFPKTITAILSRNGTNISSSITWSWMVLSGTVNGVAPVSAYQTNASTGQFSLDITSFSGVEGKIRLRAIYSGTTRVFEIPITVTNDPVSTGATAGTATNQSSLSSFGNTTAASNTYGLSDNVMPNVRTGTAGTITFAGNLEFRKGSTNTVGSVQAFGKYQYRLAGSGGAWIDAAAEKAGGFSTTDQYTEEGITYKMTEAAFLDTAQTKTGLTASTDYEIRLALRDGSTAFGTTDWANTVTATGS